MKIERSEVWGDLIYDTTDHTFSRVEKNGSGSIPYTNNPILLNIDLTLNCNMNCMHCVAKDFINVGDLEITDKMLRRINESKFMVIVITGGEPLLHEYENNLLKLLQGIEGKGLIIDTNGTIQPSKKVVDTILNTDTLVRVSWDAIRPQDETYFRKAKSHAKVMTDLDKEYYYSKFKTIDILRSEGVKVAAQSVIHKHNIDTIIDMPEKITDLKIKKWYIQRYIPAHLVAGNRTLDISTNDYENKISELIKKCSQMNIECIAKKDRRHNSVFLLVGDGDLYTQGELPGMKIRLGKIETDMSYFLYVSSSDHSERYYA